MLPVTQIPLITLLSGPVQPATGTQLEFVPSDTNRVSPKVVLQLLMSFSSRYLTPVAYTSFEADGKGGWDFPGTPVPVADAPTGRNMYVLGGESIYSGPLQRDNYIVSFWATNGSSITISSIKPVPILTKGNYTLYYASIRYPFLGDPAMPEGIFINGTGMIDELRLYPKGASMTSKC